MISKAWQLIYVPQLPTVRWSPISRSLQFRCQWSCCTCTHARRNHNPRWNDVLWSAPPWLWMNGKIKGVRTENFVLKRKFFARGKILRNLQDNWLKKLWIERKRDENWAAKAISCGFGSDVYEILFWRDEKIFSLKMILAASTTRGWRTFAISDEIYRKFALKHLK